MFKALVIDGKPTTMIPLQKLENSCRIINWVITMMARFLERTGFALVVGRTSDDASTSDAELPSGAVEMGGHVFIVPELGPSFWSSRVVVVAISGNDGKV
jgi:hypothetical protein